MPKFVIAHRSGAHRLAAIALYRALVSQCSKLDIPAERGNELHNLIKNRFSRFRHTTSHRELKLLFEAGYEAVDHLDAAVAGDGKSKQYVLDLVRRAPYSAKKGHAVTRRFVSEEYNDPFGHPSTWMPRHVESVAREVTQQIRGGTLTPLIREFAVPSGAEKLETAFEDYITHSMAQKAAAPPSDGDDHVQSMAMEVHRQIEEGTVTPLIRKLEMENASEGSFTETQQPLDKTDLSYIPLVKPRPRQNATSRRASIFDRAIPHSELGGTGKRRIPKIFSANQIPVLRLKKPQSPALTAYLNHRVKQRQERHNKRHNIENRLRIATLEDQWDDMMKEHISNEKEEEEEEKEEGNEQENEEEEDEDVHRHSLPTKEHVTRALEPRWNREFIIQLESVNASLHAEKVKNRAMAQKMYEVIDRETKLVEEEIRQVKLEQERRRHEIEEGLGGLSDMLGDIIQTGDSFYRPMR